MNYVSIGSDDLHDAPTRFYPPISTANYIGVRIVCGIQASTHLLLDSTPMPEETRSLYCTTLSLFERKKEIHVNREGQCDDEKKNYEDNSNEAFASIGSLPLLVLSSGGGIESSIVSTICAASVATLQRNLGLQLFSTTTTISNSKEDYIYPLDRIGLNKLLATKNATVNYPKLPRFSMTHVIIMTTFCTDDAIFHMQNSLEVGLNQTKVNAMFHAFPEDVEECDHVFVPEFDVVGISSELLPVARHKIYNKKTKEHLININNIKKNKSHEEFSQETKTRDGDSNTNNKQYAAKRQEETHVKKEKLDEDITMPLPTTTTSYHFIPYECRVIIMSVRRFVIDVLHKRLSLDLLNNYTYIDDMLPESKWKRMRMKNVSDPVYGDDIFHSSTTIPCASITGDGKGFHEDTAAVLVNLGIVQTIFALRESDACSPNAAGRKSTPQFSHLSANINMCSFAGELITDAQRRNNDRKMIQEEYVKNNNGNGNTINKNNSMIAISCYKSDENERYFSKCSLFERVVRSFSYCRGSDGLMLTPMVPGMFFLSDSPRTLALMLCPSKMMRLKSNMVLSQLHITSLLLFPRYHSALHAIISASSNNTTVNEHYRYLHQEKLAIKKKKTFYSFKQHHLFPKNIVDRNTCEDKKNVSFLRLSSLQVKPYTHLSLLLRLELILIIQELVGELKRDALLQGIAAGVPEEEIDGILWIAEDNDEDFEDEEEKAYKEQKKGNIVVDNFGDLAENDEEGERNKELHKGRKKKNSYENETMIVLESEGEAECGEGNVGKGETVRDDRKTYYSEFDDSCIVVTDSEDKEIEIVGSQEEGDEIKSHHIINDDDDKEENILEITDKNDLFLEDEQKKKKEGKKIQHPRKESSRFSQSVSTQQGKRRKTQRHHPSRWDQYGMNGASGVKRICIHAINTEDILLAHKNGLAQVMKSIVFSLPLSADDNTNNAFSSHFCDNNNSNTNTNTYSVNFSNMPNGIYSPPLQPFIPSISQLTRTILESILDVMHLLSLLSYRDYDTTPGTFLSCLEDLLHSYAVSALASSGSSRSSFFSSRFRGRRVPTSLPFAMWRNQTVNKSPLWTLSRHFSAVMRLAQKRVFITMRLRKDHQQLQSQDEVNACEHDGFDSDGEQGCRRRDHLQKRLKKVTLLEETSMTTTFTPTSFSSEAEEVIQNEFIREMSIKSNNNFTCNNNYNISKVSCCSSPPLQPPQQQRHHELTSVYPVTTEVSPRYTKLCEGIINHICDSLMTTAMKLQKHQKQRQDDLIIEKILEKNSKKEEQDLSIDSLVISPMLIVVKDYQTLIRVQRMLLMFNGIGKLGNLLEDGKGKFVARQVTAAMARVDFCDYLLSHRQLLVASREVRSRGREGKGRNIYRKNHKDKVQKEQRERWSKKQPKWTSMKEGDDGSIIQTIDQEDNEDGIDKEISNSNSFSVGITTGVTARDIKDDDCLAETSLFLPEASSSISNPRKSEERIAQNVSNTSAMNITATSLNQRQNQWHKISAVDQQLGNMCAEAYLQATRIFSPQEVKGRGSLQLGELSLSGEKVGVKAAKILFGKEEFHANVNDPGEWENQVNERESEVRLDEKSKNTTAIDVKVEDRYAALKEDFDDNDHFGLLMRMSQSIFPTQEQQGQKQRNTNNNNSNMYSMHAKIQKKRESQVIYYNQLKDDGKNPLLLMKKDSTTEEIVSISSSTDNDRKEKEECTIKTEIISNNKMKKDEEKIEEKTFNQSYYNNKLSQSDILHHSERIEASVDVMSSGYCVVRISTLNDRENDYSDFIFSSTTSSSSLILPDPHKTSVCFIHIIADATITSSLLMKWVMDNTRVIDGWRGKAQVVLFDVSAPLLRTVEQANHEISVMKLNAKQWGKAYQRPQQQRYQRRSDVSLLLPTERFPYYQQEESQQQKKEKEIQVHQHYIIKQQEHNNNNNNNNLDYKEKKDGACHGKRGMQEDGNLSCKKAKKEVSGNHTPVHMTQHWGELTAHLQPVETIVFGTAHENIANVIKKMIRKEVFISSTTQATTVKKNYNNPIDPPKNSFLSKLLKGAQQLGVEQCLNHHYDDGNITHNARSIDPSSSVSAHLITPPSQLQHPRNLLTSNPVTEDNSVEKSAILSLIRLKSDVVDAYGSWSATVSNAARLALFTELKSGQESAMSGRDIVEEEKGMLQERTGYRDAFNNNIFMNKTTLLTKKTLSNSVYRRIYEIAKKEYTNDANMVDDEKTNHNNSNHNSRYDDYSEKCSKNTRMLSTRVLYGDPGLVEAQSPPASLSPTIISLSSNALDTASIVIDEREFRATLPYYLYVNGVTNLAVRTLAIGDYVLSPHMCVIERKSFQDLVQSTVCAAVSSGIIGGRVGAARSSQASLSAELRQYFRNMNNNNNNNNGLFQNGLMIASPKKARRLAKQLLTASREYYCPIVVIEDSSAEDCMHYNFSGGDGNGWRGVAGFGVRRQNLLFANQAMISMNSIGELLNSNNNNNNNFRICTNSVKYRLTAGLSPPVVVELYRQLTTLMRTHSRVCWFWARSPSHTSKLLIALKCGIGAGGPQGRARKEKWELEDYTDFTSPCTNESSPFLGTRGCVNDRFLRGHGTDFINNNNKTAPSTMMTLSSLISGPLVQQYASRPLSTFVGVGNIPVNEYSECPPPSFQAKRARQGAVGIHEKAMEGKSKKKRATTSSCSGGANGNNKEDLYGSQYKRSWEVQGDKGVSPLTQYTTQVVEESQLYQQGILNNKGECIKEDEGGGGGRGINSRKQQQRTSVAGWKNGANAKRAVSGASRTAVAVLSRFPGVTPRNIVGLCKMVPSLSSMGDFSSEELKTAMENVPGEKSNEEWNSEILYKFLHDPLV